MASISNTFTKMRALIIFCVFGTALATILPQPQDVSTKKQAQRVVGGEPADISQYPFMSNMEYFWWGIMWTQWCGGSLITPTTVLSAAHCFIGDSASQWRVRLGSSSLTGGELHYVTRLILHPHYDNNMLVNDVAVIRLATAAVTSKNVGLARLSGPAYTLNDNAVAYVVGWGSLWSGGPSPDVLQHVDVQIINHEICTERYAYLKTLPGFQNWPDITHDMVCAGILDVGGKDACQGDSGGPLAQDGVVIGITSWGRGCADSYYPGVNARVSALTDFIVPNAL